MICIKCHQEVPDGKYCLQCGTIQQPKRKSQLNRRRGNGQGTVIKRNKTFTAIVTIGSFPTDDGKWHQIRKTKGGFRTRTEAVAYLPTLKEQIEKPNPSTFAALLQSYKAGAFKKLSASKQVAYNIAAERWKKIMHLDAKEATIAELQKVLDSEAQTYYPARDMQSVLSHMYKIAMAEKSVSVNLARMLTLPELEEEAPEPFTEIELHKIWASYSAGNQFLGFVLLMIYSGMMPGELLKLKADMIDWAALEIRGCGLKTKKRKEAPIVFPALIIPVLQDLCDHQGKSGKLAAINKDRFYKVYYESLEEAGVRKLPPYSCRHTTATALALGNIAPSAIQEVMRHSKLATTQRYIHMTSNEAHTAINTLSKGKEA